MTELILLLVLVPGLMPLTLITAREPRLSFGKQPIDRDRHTRQCLVRGHHHPCFKERIRRT